MKQWNCPGCIRDLGLTPERYSTVAMGGPYEPVDENDGTPGAGSDLASADAQFRALEAETEVEDDLAALEAALGVEAPKLTAGGGSDA